MSQKKKQKSNDFACQHKGCENRHKSTTGFCYEHAADIDKQRLKGRKVFHEPLLWEERLDLSTTPAVTIK